MGVISVPVQAARLNDRLPPQCLQLQPFCPYIREALGIHWGFARVFRYKVAVQALPQCIPPITVARFIISRVFSEFRIWAVNQTLGVASLSFSSLHSLALSEYPLPFFPFPVPLPFLAPSLRRRPPKSS